MACKLAALIHARGGEAQAAVACLKIALCRIEFPGTHQIPTYQRYFTMTGALSTYELARLFPKGMAGFVDPGAWLKTAKESVLNWIDEKRFDVAMPVRLLAIALGMSGWIVRSDRLGLDGATQAPDLYLGSHLLGRIGNECQLSFC